MKTELLSKLASVHLLTARRALAAFLFVFLAALSLCLWFDMAGYEAFSLAYMSAAYCGVISIAWEVGRRGFVRNFARYDGDDQIQFTIATHPWLSWTAVMITLFFVPTFA